MNRALFPACCIVMVLAGSVAHAGDPEDLTLFRKYRAIDSRVLAAGKALAAHRADEARQLLAPCLAEVPDHPEAHFLLARMAYENHDFAGALAHMEISERTLADLGRRYRRQLETLKANDEAEESAYNTTMGELGPKGVEPYGCGSYLYTTKKQALNYLEAKKGHLNDPEGPYQVPAGYHLLHGNCLYRLGRRAEAIDQYRLALAVDPRESNAWNNLIALLMETGDAAGARDSLGQAEKAGISLPPALREAVLAPPVTPR